MSLGTASAGADGCRAADALPPEPAAAPAGRTAGCSSGRVRLLWQERGQDLPEQNKKRARLQLVLRPACNAVRQHMDMLGCKHTLRFNETRWVGQVWR